MELPAEGPRAGEALSPPAAQRGADQAESREAESPQKQCLCAHLFVSNIHI